MTTAVLEQEKQAGRGFWDANPCGGQWESYRAFLDWYQRTEPYAFELLKEHDWKGRQVLEVGCGQGILAEYLRSLGADVVGIDMSLASLRRAAEGGRELGRTGGVELLQADAESLPFGDAAFDAVISFGVLHHTPDTDRAIGEACRVLRPDGRAIVMLYRTGNPKWWATAFVRSTSKLFSLLPRLRGNTAVGDAGGTALLELFGVPTMKAFSNAESRAMFRAYSHVTIRNYQPGFRRLADVMPLLRPLAGVLGWIDRAFERRWGFYQVIEGRRS